MIPRRITLRGFLCYRDEQVVDLDGADLWVLSGRNGSGKSAIFDAMTFALFGAHRGGKQNAASLINADSPELCVTLEFDLGPERYRVRRSLRRKGSPSPQVFRHEREEGGPGRWPAVPETDRIAGFNRWVQENVGLTYETFTASVLLLQGRAESLLGAQPKDRFEILAGIVDLDRYRRLQRRADARRQEARARAEAVRHHLRDLPAVEPAAIAEARRLLEESEAARVSAELAWRRSVRLEALADQWSTLLLHRDEALRRVEHGRDMLESAGQIERDAARLRELDAVLPAVSGNLERRARIEAAERALDDLDAALRALGRRQGWADALALDVRRQRVENAGAAGRDESRRRAIADRLADLAGPIERLKAARGQREQIARLSQVLASYPAGLEEDVARLETEHRQLAEWVAALPLLRSLARERAELAAARARCLEAARAVAALDDEIRALEVALADHRTSEAAAREAERQARDRWTEASTLLHAAETRLRGFTALQGAASCDRCGQPLTPEHYAVEADRLQDERERARLDRERADVAHRRARADLKDAQFALTECEGSHRRATLALADARRESEQALCDTERHDRNGREALAQLQGAPRLAALQEAPDDGCTSAFPTAADLESIDRRRAELDSVAARLAQVRAQREAMREDRTRLDQADRFLSALGLQAGDERSEELFDELTEERAALDRRIAEHNRSDSLAVALLSLLDEVGRATRERRQELDRRLVAERSRLALWREEADRVRESLPESWRATYDSATADALAALDGVRTTLRRRDVERRAAELPQALQALRQAEAEVAELECRLATIPEEARALPPSAARAREQAAADLQAADELRRGRQAFLDSLRRDRRLREVCEARMLQAEREHVLAETLANLLGREGLQRDLLREAERGILDCANPILAEISGGELGLRLATGAADDQALQLLAQVRTHGRRVEHDVAFLSGSQKFRVAVSLALGIGQYARGLHRPIESVIIDEGFGCLDRQGRQEMIAELMALKGRLARILLVSHQEEFAEAFADGYQFEVVDGSTVAQPFHR
jgi:DNA repair exonuclease SbcCD ATPase subunit